MQQLCGQPVRELFANKEVKQELEKRLEGMPKISISRVDLEWLQVNLFFHLINAIKASFIFANM